MKILILYFSGTGNTYYIAHYIYDHLQQSQIPAEIRSIENLESTQLTDYDVLCLGFPVYAMDSPSVVQRFIESLPIVENKGAFVFCSKGLASGNSTRVNLKRLQKKRFRALGSLSIIMPGSDGLAMMKPNSGFIKSAKKKDYDHLKKLDKFIDRIVEINQQILSGKKISDIREKLSINVAAYLFDWLWHLAYKWIENSFRKKFYADDKCNQCGICAQICSAENIEMIDAGIQFKDQCLMCMRCVNQCPQEAIQIGKLTVGKFRWKGPKESFTSKVILHEVKNRTM